MVRSEGRILKGRLSSGLRADAERVAMVRSEGRILKAGMFAGRWLTVIVVAMVRSEGRILKEHDWAYPECPPGT